MKDDRKLALTKLINETGMQVCSAKDFKTENCIAFPVADLAAVGGVFSGIAAGLSSLPTAAKATEKLYRASFPVAGKLAKAKDGSGFLGTIINKKGLAGQARFHEVKDVASATASVSTIFIAMAIMAINASLKEVAKGQTAILDFLETDKQTKLRGDLDILNGIMSDYGYNWDNKQFLSNREMQVLDIKRSSEQNILFYREMTDKAFGKDKFVSLDAKKRLNDAHNKLTYYKLAIYLFAYSTFLEVMLLGNFDEKYLEAAREKIRLYSEEYQKFYDATLKNVEKLSSASIQSRALQGVSAASNFMGKQIGKIKDEKNKIKVDDKLLTLSDKLNKFGNESAEKTKGSFASDEDSGIKLFSDRIALVGRLHNEPIEIATDGEMVYLPE